MILARLPVVGAAALALLASFPCSSSLAQAKPPAWKALPLGSLTGYVATVAHRPDGRFLFGTNSELYGQNAFGSAAMTKFARGTLSFDPAFIALRSDTEALVGVGGFAASGVHAFNPQAPAAGFATTPLATLQAYACVWWGSWPNSALTSIRPGWIVTGTNGGTGRNVLYYVSADGLVSGALTEELCDYSGGLACLPTGDALYTVLSQGFNSPDVAEDKTVLRYSHAQIESAITGLVNAAPAPLAKAAATAVCIADHSASLAVDNQGQIWTAGWESSTVHLYNASLNAHRRLVPQHPLLKGAAGPPSYSVQVFQRDAVWYVSCVATDSLSYLTNGSAIYLTYREISGYDVPPEITSEQTFPTARVGSDFSYQVQMAPGWPLDSTARWTAHGLPPGLSIDPVTGLISGKPTAAGEFSEVWFTVVDPQHGTATSLSFVLSVEALPTVAQGTFFALADRTGSSTAGLGARVDFSIASTADITGKLTLGKKSFPFKGQLDSATTNPTASITVLRPGLGSLQLSLTVDASSGALTGSLSDGTMPPAVLSGWRGSNRSDLIGQHNFAAKPPSMTPLTQPLGSSYGWVKTDAKGKAVVTGRTADGLAFTSSSCLGSQGQVLLYQPLYIVPGSLIGSLAIAADAAGTVTGNLSWSHPAQTSGSYRDGWAGELSLIVNGGKYRPVSGSRIVLNALPSPANNASLTVSAGAALAAKTLRLRLSAPASASVAAPHRVSVPNSSGAFTASYVVSGITLRVEGLIIPNPSTPNAFDGQGEGFFIALLPGQTKPLSGRAVLTAP